MFKIWVIFNYKQYSVVELKWGYADVWCFVRFAFRGLFGKIFVTKMNPNLANLLGDWNKYFNIPQFIFLCG